MRPVYLVVSAVILMVVLIIIFSMLTGIPNVFVDLLERFLNWG